MQSGKLLDPCYEYRLDDEEHIRPLHQMGWVKEPWNDLASFDEAIAEIAASRITMADAFPDEGWAGPTSLDWRELQAKRHLNIEEGFFMVTGVNIEYAVFRFLFRNQVFFSMRPDFGFRSLASDLGERPINAVELAVWNRLLNDYSLETGAIRRAIDSEQLSPTNVYPVEWWREFWSVRGLGHVLTAADQLPAEGPARDLLGKRAETTYLTIIGALLELVRTPRPGRDSDAAVIRELIENYSDKPGISKTTLETKFTEARRRLNSG